MTTPTQERVFEAMTALGLTADEVADRLREEGCKGVVGSRDGCPVAVYLDRRLPGLQVQVGVHVTSFNDPEAPYRLRRSTISTAWGAKQFVMEFDQDTYPDLVVDGVVLP